MRGGARPGAGRKKGSRDKKIIESLPFISKAREFAQFYDGLLKRAQAGQQPTAADKKNMNLLAAELARLQAERRAANPEKPGNLLPLEFMLKIMNDPGEDPELRARMAQAAAPFCHARAGEGKGKKEEKADRAKSAGAGRFAAGAPPLRVVNK